MSERWADHIDHGDEEFGHFADDVLTRPTYPCSRVDGTVHAGWEQVDGAGARGMDTIFVHPVTGAVSAGEVAAKEAAAYQASLIPPVEEWPVRRAGYHQSAIFVHPVTGAVSAGEVAHVEAAKYRAGLQAKVAPAVGVSAGSVAAEVCNPYAA